MFQMLTILIMIASLVLSFIFHPSISWIPIIFIDIVICIQLWVARKKHRFNHIADLSPDANKFLQRYGHYFAMPFASKDFSASAATSQFAGIIIAIVGLFRGFWWGIGLAVANWFIMGFVSVSLSPASLLTKAPSLQTVNDNILRYIHSQRNQSGADHSRS